MLPVFLLIAYSLKLIAYSPLVHSIAQAFLYAVGIRCLISNIFFKKATKIVKYCESNRQVTSG